MVTRKNDEAVSPVIGVILMVAITVILAAVIAAFVFGMSGNISKTKTVAVTVQKIDSNTISVMNNGGQDASSLTNITVTTSPAYENCYVGTSTTATNCYAYQVPSLAVGTVLRIVNTTTNAFNVKTQVIAVGTFNDGSTQVLLDTFV